MEFHIIESDGIRTCCSIKRSDLFMVDVDSDVTISTGCVFNNISRQ